MATEPSTEARQPTTAATTDREPDAADLPLDVVFDLLSNQRRRQVLRYLLSGTGNGSTAPSGVDSGTGIGPGAASGSESTADADGGTATLGDLAEHIAAIENDKPEDALSSTERKRVYICLYQCHLPRMDDAGVVDFDEHRKTVDLDGNAADVIRFLPERDDAGRSRGDGGWTAALASVVGVVGDRFRGAR